MRTSYHPDLRYHGKAWPACKDRHKNGRAKGASASQWKYVPLLLLSEQNLGNCQWLQIGLLDMPFICKSVHPTTAFTNSINPTVHGWLLMGTLMGHIWVSLLFPPSIPRLLLLLVLFSCALKKTVQWLCFEEQDRPPPSVSHRMISEPIFCLWERQQWATGWTCMWCLAVCDIVSGLCCAFLKMTKYFLCKMNILILDCGGEVLFTFQVRCLRNRSVTKWESCGAPQTSTEPRYGKKSSRSRLF